MTKNPQRVHLRSEDPPQHDARCWHCGRAVEGRRVVRYLYPSDRPRTAIVEDWYRCPCGAYQNVRRPTEITVETLDRS
jgi:sarcosine oxidase delta subunit